MIDPGDRQSNMEFKGLSLGPTMSFRTRLIIEISVSKKGLGMESNRGQGLYVLRISKQSHCSISVAYDSELKMVVNKNS